MKRIINLLLYSIVEQNLLVSFPKTISALFFEQNLKQILKYLFSYT